MSGSPSLDNGFYLVLDFSQLHEKEWNGVQCELREQGLLLMME